MAEKLIFNARVTGLHGKLGQNLTFLTKNETFNEL
jgi:hypothetical protein